jgi:hypothetical protein
LNVGKLKLLTASKKLHHPTATSEPNSRAQTLRAVLALDGLKAAHAQKPSRYCFASAFVPISDENLDGGRAFSCPVAEKADSVSRFRPA